MLGLLKPIGSSFQVQLLVKAAGEVDCADSARLLSNFRITDSSYARATPAGASRSSFAVASTGVLGNGDCLAAGAIG